MATKLQAKELKKLDVVGIPHEYWGLVFNLSFDLTCSTHVLSKKPFLFN